YQRIIYISCNPETLTENIHDLSSSHKVTAAAMFDQFPYTDHIETGVVLERKS
ncbi:MAG: tRNA (uridine(54)-C5)-methyltransferase TrmA, partial [Idiomarina sp.]|nr:tRNA (uridine(54)-C5)-methyltransferase TrmA [Idiomarina sp.]